MLRYVLVLSLGFFLVGCVTTQEYQSLQNRVNTLERRQQQAAQNRASRIEQLEKQFAALQEETSHLVSNKTERMRSHQADLWSEFENMRVDVATLQGKMEQVQYNLGQLQSQATNQTQTLADLQNKVEQVDRQLSLAEAQLGLDFSDIEKEEAIGAKPTSDSDDPKDDTSSSTPQLLYKKALSAFHNREYDQAKELWAEFATQFPKHDLVANAYFWQGECLYQMEKYAQAVLLYDKVISEYEQSGKYPSALLKQGLSLYALDKKKAGRIRLQQLMNDYGDTAEAKRARSFLDGQ